MTAADGTRRAMGQLEMLVSVIGRVLTSLAKQCLLLFLWLLEIQICTKPTN